MFFFFLAFYLQIPQRLWVLPAWPLTGLYGKELEELKAHVCAGTPRLPSSCEYINSFATLRLPKPNICRCTFFYIYDDESKHCSLDWVTQKGQALGLAGGGQEGMPSVLDCECELALSWERPSTSQGQSTPPCLSSNMRANMVQLSKQFTWIWVLWIHELKFHLFLWGQRCWWKDVEVCVWKP